MSLASVTEQVNVTAEAPVVDVRQSGRSNNIRAEQIELTPHNRDFTSLLTQAPGVQQEAKSGTGATAGIMIDGASAAENRYVVDGIETTDLVHGQSGKNVLADFVEEVQVKSTGYPAEYGGSTGGVINVITKSGTNKFNGNLLTFFQGSSTTGQANPVLRLGLTNANIAEYVTYPQDTLTRVEPGGAIGGPIMKDRMWFFGAYQPAISNITRNISTTTSANPAANPSSTTQQQRVQYITANQTMQLSDKLRTRIAFNNSWSETLGQLATITGSDKPGTIYTKGTKFPSWTLSGQADYIVSPKLFLGVPRRPLRERHA